MPVSEQQQQQQVAAVAVVARLACEAASLLFTNVTPWTMLRTCKLGASRTKGGGLYTGTCRAQLVDEGLELSHSNVRASQGRRRVGALTKHHFHHVGRVVR